MGQTVSAKRDPNETARAASLYTDVKPLLQELVEEFKDKVIIPSASGNNEAYHEARTRPFAYSDSGYPVAIFFPETTEQVARLIKLLFNIRHGLDVKNVKIAVAAGCHGHMSMASSCVVVDLKRMTQTKFDPTTKTIAVSGGAKLQHVTQALAGSGYSVSTGTHGDTGVAGLTLAGGMGYISNKVGMACDTLREATVVLATGDVVVARDDNEYKDLMRALRGGGGNFGIVTNFVFDCYDVTNTFGGVCLNVCPGQKRLKTYLRQYNDVVNNKMHENEMTRVIIVVGAPIVINVACTFGPENKQTKQTKDVGLFKQIKRIKGPILKKPNFKRMDFNTQLMTMEDKMIPRGNGSSGAFCIPNLDEQIIDALVHFTRVDVPPGGMIMLAPMRFKLSTGLPARPHCVGHREMKYWLIAASSWKRDEDRAKADAWKTRLFDTVRKLGAAATSHTLDGADSAAPYKGEIKEFLAKTKAKFDPTNFWRMNVNVSPEAQPQ